MFSKHFAPLIGNPLAKDFLLRLCEQKGDLRSLLFSGPEGVGKKSFAIAFIQTLWGDTHAEKIRMGTHPDFICVQPEGKTKIHTIASIKKVVLQAAVLPFEAPHRVFLIEDADRMQIPAANALLKTLEEPLVHMKFILLSSSIERILPTILSRCVRIPFYPIEQELLCEELQKQGIAKADAMQQAIVSEGSFKKSGALTDPIRSLFIDILRQFFLVRISPAFIAQLDALEKQIEKKEETAAIELVEGLFSDLLFWVRDLHYLRIGARSDELFHSKYREELYLQSKKQIPSLEKVVEQIELARLGVERHSKFKVVFEQMFAAFVPQLSFA